MVQKINWIRYEKNPVFPTIPGTWMESQTANPEPVIDVGDSGEWDEGASGLRQLRKSMEFITCGMKDMEEAQPEPRPTAPTWKVENLKLEWQRLKPTVFMLIP